MLQAQFKLQTCCKHGESGCVVLQTCDTQITNMLQYDSNFYRFLQCIVILQWWFVSSAWVMSLLQLALAAGWPDLRSQLQKLWPNLRRKPLLEMGHYHFAALAAELCNRRVYPSYAYIPAATYQRQDKFSNCCTARQFSHPNWKTLEKPGHRHRNMSEIC